VRLVCISAEAAEICWSLGVWDQVVGVSAFAPKHLPVKPIVSGFATGKVEQILAVAPDLVISFSNVQANLTDQLVRAGVSVFALNYFDLDGIGRTISWLGRLLAVPEKGEKLANEFRLALEGERFAPLVRPRVYFEEWDDPLIHGVPWVQEIIELVGGTYVFKDLGQTRAQDRIVTEELVFSTNPEIILASWCGKTVDVPAILARPAFAAIEAVKQRHVYSLDSEKILQAGPQLLNGVKEIRKIVQGWCLQQEKARESA
jgi:iron complex transport system substrate-binding protein